MDAEGKEVYVPFNDVIPMVHPNDIEVDGWDISSMNLADAMERACVLDYSLQKQIRPHLQSITPRPSIYCPDFIAANQVRIDYHYQNYQNYQTLSSYQKISTNPYQILIFTY